MFCGLWGNNTSNMTEKQVPIGGNRISGMLRVFLYFHTMYLQCNSNGSHQQKLYYYYYWFRSSLHIYTFNVWFLSIPTLRGRFGGHLLFLWSVLAILPKVIIAFSERWKIITWRLRKYMLEVQFIWTETSIHPPQYTAILHPCRQDRHHSSDASSTMCPTPQTHPALHTSSPAQASKQIRNSIVEGIASLPDRSPSPGDSIFQ